MSTTNVDTLVAGQHLINQRLDALDRALLALLPRHDRLALVKQVELRIGELSADPAVLANLPEAADGSPFPELARAALTAGPVSILPAASLFAPNRSEIVRPSGSKRSRLALSAGLTGIAALGLLSMVPVSYVVLSTIGELLGEVIVFGLLGAHVLAMAIGGAAAVVLGIVALARLQRRHDGLAGRGWAIAGLCAGPLPLLVGGLCSVAGGLQVLAAEDFTLDSAYGLLGVATSSPPEDQDSTTPVETSAPSDSCPAYAGAPLSDPVRSAQLLQLSVQPAGDELPPGSESHPPRLPQTAPQQPSEPPAPDAVPLPEPVVPTGP